MSRNSSEIKMSVASVTRNRPEILYRCLESLRSQSVQPLEVIVSDDSDPEIAPRTEAVAKQWDCLYIPGPRRGLQANLNNAVSVCKGTHIRIVNDDHIFPENHLKIIQQVVESDPDSIWILSEYYEMPGSNSILQLPGEIQPRGYHKPITSFDDCFAIGGGASIYPRQIFERHRFLEAFGYVCDLEFGPRLKGLGYRIRYCPETYVIHLSVGEFEERVKQHQEVLIKGAFLIAYLTYGCYLKDDFKKIECLGYFWVKSLLNSLKLKKSYFRLGDFWKTFQIANQYIKMFKAEKYEQIV